MTKPVRVIQVGLGPWGLDWARRIVPSVPGVEAVAWVDPAADARAAAVAEAKAPAGCCFASLADALGAVEAEALLCTAALAGHRPVIEDGLTRGLHVLTEKPFAESAAVAQKLADAAAGAGRILHVSQNYRSYPATRKARELIATGRLGDVVAVDIDFHKYVPDHPYRAFTNALLVDMLIHHFDLIRFLLGEEPAEVVAWTWNPPGSTFRDDASMAALIRMTGGAVVTLRGTWLSRDAPTNWAGNWRLQCADGHVGFTSRSGGGSGDTSGDRMVLRPLGGAEQDVPLDPLPLFGRAGLLDAFARTVRGETPPAWATTGTDNLGTLRLMEATIRSAANGGAATPVG